MDRPSILFAILRDDGNGAIRMDNGENFSQGNSVKSD